VASLWHRSRWFRAGGVVLALGLIAAASLPVLIPVDRFRPLLIQLIEANTGRQVQIDALRLHVLPTVGLQAVNVRVRNSQGFPQGNAVIVKSVDLHVGLLALLSRKLDVTSIVLGGVQVNLLRDASGRTNLELPVPLVNAPPRRTTVAGGGALLTLDHLGAVAVTNVEVTMARFDARTEQVTPSLALSGVNARIGAIDLSAPDALKRLEITSALRGVRITTPALAKPVQFDAGDLLIKGGAARGTFSATLDTMRVTGTVAIASLDPFSVITFAAAIPDLDIARMDRLPILTPGGDPALSAVRRLLARGTVTIDRLVLSPYEATQMHGRLSVYTNAIQMDSYAFSAYGGTVRGAAALDYSTAGLPATLTATMRGIRVERVLSAGEKITGTLEADLTLATEMGSTPEAALRGGGIFAVRNGSFPRLDLKSTMQKLAAAVHLITVPPGPTLFSYFGGDLRVAQQRVFSNAVRLEAAGLEGTARGSFGFDRTLEYVGTGAMKTPASSPGAKSFVGRTLRKIVPGTAGAAGTQVPFAVGGTFDDPTFSPAGTPPPVRAPRPRQPVSQPGPNSR
jgi:uncharacterized protein involved in outer membrane biogenesis